MQYPEDLPHQPRGFEDILNPQSPLTHIVGPSSSTPFTIRIPMQLRNRASIGSAHSQASGSMYHESNNSVDIDMDAAGDEDAEGEENPSPTKVYSKSSRGRRIAVASYKESDSEPDPLAVADLASDPVNHAADDEDGEEEAPRRSGRRTRAKPSMVLSSDDGESAGGRRYATRSQSKKPEPSTSNGSRRTRRTAALGQEQPFPSRSRRLMRGRPGMRTRKSAQEEEDADGYIDEPEASANSAEESMEAFPEASSDIEVDGDDGEVEVEVEVPVDGRPYSLRQRAKVNYAIPPPLEEIPSAPPKPPGRGRAGGGRSDWNRKKGPGWSATGAELGQFLGIAVEDSDSDAPRAPHRGLGGPALTGGVGGIVPSDLAAAAGTPANFGKVGDAALADADPLGVNQNVTFDEVGGLDDHINSLKEMTLLPLLYPEVFQRFNVTPPRGVLFHGPPGTGKTLLARALAASSRSNGKGISFFMRKGADVLSKWVGEAERQLRLLFEEARNCQPSIIFFDEIDGLAPVRSSKQDQIHASIVSTLLALMDGMDGRGQVVVIGATNRPDAVDPALRRPGRFDREFYFPLPVLEAREKILRIMTKKWAGWDGDRGEEHVKGLAKLTKGYGGADLRALCTEAALNAVQRRYPQIYKSSDRLLLQPDTINVELRDFMISVKKLVPSSARSSSSVASPLPSQLVPLLSDYLSQVKDVLGRVMPIGKKRTALEEAEWEDEGEDGALEREMMLQSMETLRLYRPRILLHGLVGMGQNYVGAAALHLLEGYHVQNLDLGTLHSDATRTTEAAIVQLFVEAKRHQPSVIYIPSLYSWCAAVSETSRGTVRAMLDSLAPTDPILLLAVVDAPYLSLPRDVRAWFGPARESRVEFRPSNALQREQFFESVLQDIRRPPNQFPDGVKRKKRVLEELPIAPPLEPRAPSAAELALQDENDMRLVTLLRYRLGPILTELKRKFKRFTKPAIEEYHLPATEVLEVVPVVNEVVEMAATMTAIDLQSVPSGLVVSEERTEVVDPTPMIPADQAHDAPPLPLPLPPPSPPPPPPPPPQAIPSPQLYNMDLERMHAELYKNRYLTPQHFLDDVGKIVHNAEVCRLEDAERLHRAQAMYTATEVSIQDFDPHFRLECERMAARELVRRQERKKLRQKEKSPAETETNGEGYAPGTRRSARTNGREPEIAITDPLKLERAARLKRQRSNEASNESPAEEEGEARGSKRSRVASHEEESPAPPVVEDARVNAHHPAPSPLEALHHVAPPLNEHEPPHLTSTPLANGVAIDTSHSSAPVEEHQPLLPILNGHSGVFSSTLSPSTTPVPTSVTNAAGDSLGHQHEPTATPPQSNSPGPSELPNGYGVETGPTIEALALEPMEVERDPTPLPDFHVDDGALSHLHSSIRDSTSGLSVEQLEQLRASCLGRIWQHRTEWDRNVLIHELEQLVAEFTEEVRLDALDSP
ncbi:AAA-domain-containing protein [Auriscalpium vulgare]|uniref:AAA-domain-containing protein n=1 Tax=Auriscalpium vulgare TaxID=40419 RepID=A0ACB8S8N2_9AGAM|nr:AAA-domain-containing protein [Auriscalpium vulgare]